MEEDENNKGGKKDSKKRRTGLSKSPFLKNTRFSKSPGFESIVDQTQEKERESMEAGNELDFEQEVLGQYLFEAVGNFNREAVKELVKAGAPVNYIDPVTKATPFHLAAAYSEWDSLQVMLDTGECNLLLREKKGRLASGCAAAALSKGSLKMEWCDKLMDMEQTQGEKAGIVSRARVDAPIPDGPS